MGPPPHAPPSVRSQGQLERVVGSPLYTGTHSTGRPLSSAVVEFPPQLTTRGPPTPPLPQLQLFTDASIEGWGAHLTSHQTFGTWSPRQRSLHINNLELLAVHLALQHFLPLVINKVVIVMTDNTTVVGQIKNQGGTHSRSLYRQTVLLLEWADSKRITLVPRHIPGHLNVVADRLSRRHQTINSEWTLSQQILHHMWRLWGQPHIDLFATSETARLPTYISLLPDPAAWRTDALSFPWTNLWAYMFPPFPLIPEVLQRIQASNCHAILVSPAWPSQPLFACLLSLLDDHPRRLPPRRTLLRQPRSWTFHLDLSRLSLHVWRLPSQPSSAEAIPRRWQPASPPHTVSPHSLSTTANGASSLSGAGALDTIHSLPLPLS